MNPLAEAALCVATLAVLLVISYLLRWVRRVMDRRFPQPPAPAAEEPRDAAVYIEGPLIMSAPDRQFHRTREPQ